MFYDTGCYGRIDVGELPADVQRRLAALPGEWLEFDPDADAIVVRHIQRPPRRRCRPSPASW